MKKVHVAVNLKGLPPVEVVQRCNEIKAGLTGNATVFTAPDPSLPDFQTRITAASNAITAADVAALAAHEAIVTRDNAIAELINAALSEGSYVESVANKAADPAATVALANMVLKNAPTKIGQLSQVQNLSLTVGDNPGEVDAHWDRVRAKAPKKENNGPWSQPATLIVP